MVRDDFSKTVKEILAKRVGFRCSNPNCRKLTSGPQKIKFKAINIGVAAHISAASEGGPRYDPTMSELERSSIENGIWLCQNCAKLIDNDPTRYAKDLLRQWINLSENAALLEVQNDIPTQTVKNDIELITFFIQCFDRPAFQDLFQIEGSMEAFDRAIEDTIIALNTGTLRSRDGMILSTSKGKSFISNPSWRKKLDTIVDLLRAIRERYSLAISNEEIHLGGHRAGRQFYIIRNTNLSDWMNSTRGEILDIFSHLCREAGIDQELIFPRERKYWKNTRP